MSVFDELAAPFAKVHWRAQNMSRDGTSALALAYIDARDVMARLDEVVGPTNWQDRYTETPKGRLICTLSVRIDGEWIEKADGAGDTDVEGEKGAISDALKRAAVKWGIGRYLYEFGDIWADCDPLKDREGNLVKNAKGKPQFKCWTAQGLRKLAAAAGSPAPAPVAAPKVSPPAENASPFISDTDRDIIQALAQSASVTLKKICESYGVDSLKVLPAEKAGECKQRLQQTIEDKRKAA
jgi:hypothetical protein